MEEGLPAALLNPAAVPSMDCVLSSIKAAMAKDILGKLKTRGFFTEVLYGLAPHGKIGLALQEFGAPPDADNLLVVTMQWQDEQRGCIDTNMEQLIEGNRSELGKIDELRCVDSIKKLYKISDGEIS